MQNVSGYFKMRLRKLIILSLGLLILTKCSSKQDSKRLVQIPIGQSQQNIELVGTWVYNYPFFYSQLILREDGTFKFHDQGHYGQNYTEGTWIKNIKGAILTSSESFMHRTAVDSTKVPISVKKVIPGKVPPPSLPGPHDTIRVFFNSVGFETIGDTLINLGNNPTFNTYKFVREKNNR